MFSWTMQRNTLRKRGLGSGPWNSTTSCRHADGFGPSNGAGDPFDAMLGPLDDGGGGAGLSGRMARRIRCGSGGGGVDFLGRLLRPWNEPALSSASTHQRKLLGSLNALQREVDIQFGPV
jgi:hypothetical protein